MCNAARKAGTRKRAKREQKKALDDDDDKGEKQSDTAREKKEDNRCLPALGPCGPFLDAERATTHRNGPIACSRAGRTTFKPPPEVEFVENQLAQWKKKERKKKKRGSS